MKPKVEDMHPWLHDAYQFWKVKMDAAGIPFILTCVGRTNAEQEALFAQGRKPLAEVNQLRRECGMSLLTEKENKSKVTWTMNSKHRLDKDGKSHAFDFAIVKPDKKTLSWDVKWDADHDGIPEYEEAVRFAEEVGLEAGARWKTPDWPHCQLKVRV